MEFISLLQHPVTVGGDTSLVVHDEDTMMHDHKTESAVHSGHFMISSLEENDDEDADDELSDSSDSKKGYDFSTARMQTFSTYAFDGPGQHSTVDIDFDLSKLFQRMSLAYSGKLTSPKWKNFKGLKISVKDKVRLNNVIWREWHLQYVNGRRPTNRYCQFEAPVPDKTHTKPEAVVLEGKYWKRKLESVCSEYRRWRRYFRDNLVKQQNTEMLLDTDSEMLDDALFQSIFRFTGTMDSVQRPLSPSSLSLFGDDLPMDLSDNILNVLASHLGFPNPREMSQLGNADIIQPGLIQLQPSLDDDLQFDPLSPLPSLQDMISNNSTKPVYIGPGLDASSRLGSLNNSASRTTTSALLPETKTSLKNPGTRGLGKGKKVTFGNTFQKTVSPSPELADLLSSVPQAAAANVLPQQCFPVSQFTQPTQTQLLSNPLLTTSGFGSAAAVQQQPQPQQAKAQQMRSVKSDSQTSQLLALLQGMNEPTQELKQRARAASAPQALSAPSRIVPDDNFKTTQSLNKQTSGSLTTAADTKASPFADAFFSGQAKENTFAQPLFVPPAEPARRSHLTVEAVVKKEAEPSVASSGSFLAQLLKKSGDNETAPKTLQGASTSTSVRKRSSDLTWPPFVTFVAPSNTVRSVTQTPSKVESNISVFNVISNSPSPMAREIQMQPTSVPSSPGGSDSELRSRHASGPTSSVDFFLPTSLKEDTPSALPNPRKRSALDPIAYREHRRTTHISSEQKRRCSIKTGFDALAALVPSLNQNPSLKVAKATVLFKAVEYCEALKKDRASLHQEMERLLGQVKDVNVSISTLQSQLPDTGAPTVACLKNSQLRDAFKQYVYTRTQSMWKFWIFSFLMEPFFESFNSSVATSDMSEMQASTLRWVEQHCGLARLRDETCKRMIVLNNHTDMVRDPSTLPKYVLEAVEKLKPASG